MRIEGVQGGINLFGEIEQRKSLFSFILSNPKPDQLILSTIEMIFAHRGL